MNASLWIAFTALCIGFALYLRRGQDAYAWAILALACLSRETGFMLAGAACLTLVIERRFTKAAVFAASVVPAVAWVGYVYLKTPGYLAPASEQVIPIQGIVQAFLQPATYPLSGAVTPSLVWLDRLGLLTFLAAVIFSLWLLRRNGFRQMEMAMLTWSLVGLCLPRSFWADCFAGPRVFSPLFAYLALRGAEIRERWTVAPLLMTIPRVLVQVAAPLLAILAGKL